MKSLAIFGSTGSIGRQALSVAEFHKEEFSVRVIAANSNADAVSKQIECFHPEYVGMYSPDSAKAIRERFPEVTVVSGEEINALAALPEIDTVVNGVSGFAGLAPLLSALNAGKTVALANKESIVCAHHVVDDALNRFGGRILPVDSEQSAIFQCLEAGRREDVRSLILTASGGMFREFSREQLQKVTPEMALHHPTWSMGGKITIDSSSLFNKGLELMEAGWLFGFGPDDIKILVHPQSIVHSMVEYRDGSVLAQLAEPDMRLAIQYALTYPERQTSQLRKLELSKLCTLSFFEPDCEKFPAIPLAYAAFRDGETLPIAYNAANEVAVEFFINKKLGFTDISACVRHVMNKIPCIARVDSADKVYSIDSDARRLAREFCENTSSRRNG